MKKFILLVFCISVLGGLKVYSQNIPDFTLYNSNMTILNPAYVGITEGLAVTAGYRRQWLGVAGSPSVLTFSASGYIPKIKVGAGLTVWQQKAGAIDQTSFRTDYSYKVDMGFASLNLGLSLGLVNVRSSYTNADLNGIIDPVFQNDANQTKFNWGGGAYLFADKYYAGFSAPVLATYSNDENTVIKLSQHYYLTGGYLFDLNEKFVLKPYTLLRIVPGSPFTYNVGVTAYYSEHFGLGLLYKSQNTFAFYFELMFDKAFHIAYSYDLPGATDIALIESGSHELNFTYTMPWGDNEQKIRFY